MSKTQKELAFLRELQIDSVWTERFTDFVDKKVDFSDEERLIYINAGTGNHAIAIREKMDKDSKIFAISENEDLLNIARDKAAAVKADVNFSIQCPESKTYYAVLADASFVRPKDLQKFFKDAVRATKPKGRIAIFTPTAASFGEIFSFFWEIFFNIDLGEHGAEAEKLIAELPAVLQLEKMAEAAGLKDIETQTSTEIFEYENGAEFVKSTLAADFLFPVWLKFLNKKQTTKVLSELAKMIDAEGGNLSFRFSVKMTLLTAEKA